jgi:hypothetical protein
MKRDEPPLVALSGYYCQCGKSQVQIFCLQVTKLLGTDPCIIECLYNSQVTLIVGIFRLQAVKEKLNFIPLKILDFPRGDFGVNKLHGRIVVDKPLLKGKFKKSLYLYNMGV